MTWWGWLLIALVGWALFAALAIMLFRAMAISGKEEDRARQRWRMTRGFARSARARTQALRRYRFGQRTRQS
jgi:hypothetical protein